MKMTEDEFLKWFDESQIAPCEEWVAAWKTYNLLRASTKQELLTRIIEAAEFNSNLVESGDQVITLEKLRSLLDKL